VFAPAIEKPADLVVPTISMYEMFKRVLQQRDHPVSPQGSEPSKTTVAGRRCARAEAATFDAPDEHAVTQLKLSEASL
jgi:hypothetical protein